MSQPPFTTTVSAVAASARVQAVAATVSVTQSADSSRDLAVAPKFRDADIIVAATRSFVFTLSFSLSHGWRVR